MKDTILHSTTDTFEVDVLRADRPVLVDFYADWCGPCQAIAPALRQVADEFRGRVDVRKVNIDQNPELARRYGIRGIPTLLLFERGEVTDSLVGLASRSALSDLAAAHAGDVRSHTNPLRANPEVHHERA